MFLAPLTAGLSIPIIAIYSYIPVKNMSPVVNFIIILSFDIKKIV